MMFRIAKYDNFFAASSLGIHRRTSAREPGKRRVKPVAPNVNTLVLTTLHESRTLRCMVRETKDAQLQIRVTRAQKTEIQRGANRAGLDLSAYVLGRVLSVSSAQFQKIVAACADDGASRFALAELNSFLAELTLDDLRAAVSMPPRVSLPPFVANYVAAMVEYGCAQRSLAPPAWTRSVEPLAEPVFCSALNSLRLYLLTRSPPPFRLRNIFIDASLGRRI